MRTYKEFIAEVSSYEKRRQNKKGHKFDSVVYVSEPGGGKSKEAEHLEQQGAAVGELDRARKKLGIHPAVYTKELGIEANKPLQGAPERGQFGVKSDTNVTKKARESSINTLKSVGYKHPIMVIPGGRSIEQNIRVANRRNRKRKVGGEPGSGRVPQAVMNRMADSMRRSGIANKKTRRQMRADWKRLHKKYRFTKPKLRRAGLIKE